MNLLALAELDPTLDRVAAGVVKRVLARVQKGRAYKHVHAAADAQLSAVQALMQAAFARGHAAISRDQLVSLISKEDHAGLMIAVDMAITATANSLHESELHQLLLKVLVDSGKTAFNHVKTARANVIERVNAARIAGSEDQPRDDHGQWTSGGSGPTKAAVKRGLEEAREQLTSENGVGVAQMSYSLKEVPISSLKLRERKNAVPSLVEAFKTGSKDIPPVSIRRRFEGDTAKAVVLDGHRRIASAKAAGKTHIWAVEVHETSSLTDKERAFKFDAEGHSKHVFRDSADPSISTDFVFDDTDPNAVEWAKDHAAELVQGISKSSRNDIRQLVEDAFTEHMTADDLADEIENVIGDAARAETIARTETMKASNVGQQQAWDQAINQGLLLGTEQQEWITTPDDKLCPICESLDGQTAALGDSFNDDNGDEYDGPPAHPNCRCTLGLSLEPANAMRAAYSPDQTRNDHGQFTVVNGTTYHQISSHATRGEAEQHAVARAKETGNTYEVHDSGRVVSEHSPRGSVRVAGNDDQPRDEHGRWTASGAKALAKTYVQIHNEHSKEQTANFKAIGAHMWHDDNAHPLKPDNEKFLAKDLKGKTSKEIRETLQVPRPLTVLDSFPQARVHSAKLERNVSATHEKYSKQWTDALKGKLRSAAYSDDEPRDDHGKWTGGGPGSTSARAQRALASHKPSTAAVQRHAESNETDVKKMVGGDTTGDNEAMDVVTKIDGKKHGVEVKTLIHNSNDKITMHPPSRRRKEQWSKDNHAIVHTVVLDDRKGRANSGHRIYYKRGVGAFRLHTMTKVKNASHLRSLMSEK